MLTLNVWLNVAIYTGWPLLYPYKALVSETWGQMWPLHRLEQEMRCLVGLMFKERTKRLLRAISIRPCLLKDQFPGAVHLYLGQQALSVLCKFSLASAALFQNMSLEPIGNFPRNEKKDMNRKVVGLQLLFSRSVTRSFLVALLFASCVSALSVSLEAQNSNAAQARARAIIAKMTLEEKIAQMHGIHDAKNFRLVPGVPRLGIPPLRVTNGPAGVGPGGSGRQLKATALPAPIALAATWDTKLAYDYGRLAGEETLALGSDLLEAPDVNIVRIPQAGRTFETYGEDPWLTSRIAVANIRGIQSAGVLANIKHYLANNQESERGSINEIISTRALQEIYMPAFKAAVDEADVNSFMCAYPRVNGFFNCENDYLINQVLKKDWKYRGFVFSDFGAVHSTEASILAGLDLEMPSGDYFNVALQNAVLQGRVPESRLDDALLRRYTIMIERGLFDRKLIERTQNEAIPILTHGRVSREIAEASMVLLKNEGSLLPLDSQKVKNIALIGPYAVRAMTGGGGSSYVTPFYTVRPEDGIYSHMQSQRKLAVLDGSDVDAAVAAAKKAQIAILMVGDDEGEDHDHPIVLPELQNKLIAAVAAANPKTIVVLKSGSAVLMPWLSSVPAVLEAWYPGEEDGDAVANILFGDSYPQGRLPISFPVRNEDTLARNPVQYPGRGGEVHYAEELLVGYRAYHAEQVKPLFAFGYGLSFTRFEYSDLSIEQVKQGEDPQIAVSFRVKNIGQREGSDVPQLYVSFPSLTEGNEPSLQLKGFEKVKLTPGEEKKLKIVLDKRAFSYWSSAQKQWTLAKGEFSLVLAASAEEPRLNTKITLP